MTIKTIKIDTCLSFLLFVLLVAQFYNIIGYILVATLIIFSLYLITKKRYFLAFAMLFLFSFEHGPEAINIYNIKILGISLIYISAFIYFMIITNFKIEKLMQYVIFIVSIYLIYSLSNLLDGGYKYYFIQVFLMIMTLLLTSIFFVAKKSDFDYEDFFLKLASIFYFTKVFLLLSGIGVIKYSYMPGINRIEVLFDPVDAFFLIFTVYFILIKKTLSIKVLIPLSLILISIYLNSSIGSSTLITLVFGILILTISNIKNFLIGITLLIFVIFGSLNIQNDIMKEKVNNIVTLIDYLDDFDVYVLPRSPQVRAIELSNFFAETNYFQILFGKGYGSYIKDNTIPFDRPNEDDFTIDQIESGKFYSLHNPAALFMMYGLLAWISIFIIAIIHKQDVLIFSLSVYLLFNFGFGFKSYILFALFIAMLLHKFKKQRN